MRKWQSQSSGLHSPSLEPISRCKTNKFFQLAVDAASLMMAKGTLGRLQGFSCLADHASLWLLFYAFSTTFFSDNWAYFQWLQSSFHSKLFFPSADPGNGWQPCTVHSSPMEQAKPDAVICLLAVVWIHPNLWVTFTYRNLDRSSVYFFSCGSQSLCIEVS